MSICTFIAVDCLLPEVVPKNEYPLHINIDEGSIYDGDADDNYFLHRFEGVSAYTNKNTGAWLEWLYYTEGKAKQMIEYIKAALQHTDSVEIWHVWLMDYYEYYSIGF